MSLNPAGFSSKGRAVSEAKFAISCPQLLVAHRFILPIGHKYWIERQNNVMFICLQAKFMKHPAAISKSGLESTDMVNVDIAIIFFLKNT